jgi:hypothetical protein
MKVLASPDYYRTCLHQPNVIQLRENTDPKGSYHSSHFILQTAMQYGEQVSLTLWGCKTNYSNLNLFNLVTSTQNKSTVSTHLIK